jgi:hypothetical protein
LASEKKKRLHFSRRPSQNPKMHKTNQAVIVTFFHHGKTISKQKLLEKQKMNPAAAAATAEQNHRIPVHWKSIGPYLVGLFEPSLQCNKHIQILRCRKVVELQAQLTLTKCVSRQITTPTSQLHRIGALSPHLTQTTL